MKSYKYRAAQASGATEKRLETALKRTHLILAGLGAYDMDAADIQTLADEVRAMAQESHYERILHQVAKIVG